MTTSFSYGARASLVLFLSFYLSAAFANSYTLVDLGDVSPTSINKSGNVAGNGTGQWFSRAKLFRGEKWHNLPPHSQASAINKNADVAGRYTDGPNIFSMAVWPWKAEPFIIPVNGTLFGLNSRRQAIGSYESGASCFIWSVEAGFADMGMMKRGDRCTARAINNTGSVVGGANTSRRGTKNAFIWRNGEFSDLGKLVGHGGDSVGTAINELGNVAGYGTADGGYEHPFFWDGTKMTELVPNWTAPVHSRPTSMNNSNEIVGTTFDDSTDEQYAVRFAEGKAIRLSSEVANLGEWKLTTATGINEDGVIVGQGNLGGYMLIPQQ